MMFATGTKVTGGGAAFSSRFSVYLATDQDIPTGVLTKVVYDTEIYDNFSEVSNGRFTAKEAGFYHLSCGARFSDVSGSKYCEIWFVKNGAEFDYSRKYANELISYQMLHCSKDIRMQVGDFVEVHVIHNMGVTIQAQGGVAINHFTGHRFA